MKPVHPKVGVGVMLKRGTKIVLGKRKGAHGEATYGRAGGKLEFGEERQECARREVLEETGIHIDNLSLICVNNLMIDGKHYIDIEYLSEISEGVEPTLMEPDKCEGWDWYELDHLPKNLFEPLNITLECLREGLFTLTG